MNTENDIELHELEAIEQRLSTEAARGAASQDRPSGNASRGFAIATGSGFEAA
jgi:hypothetical protein